MTAELRSRFQLLTPQISTDDLFLPTTKKGGKEKGKGGAIQSTRISPPEWDGGEKGGGKWQL